LPTGFGKTVLFVELIEALNLRTLIAVPTTQLIDQTEESFQDFAEDLEVGKIYEKAKEFGRQVTIITYQSLIPKVKSGEINPGDFDCLILDEAHKALGPETMKTIQKFDKAVKLGFTATPDYSEEKGVSALLET
jgi:superfamily II DNA or RNA helicase